MKLQLIRNATLRLNYAGKSILIDPYLAAKHSLPSYTGRSPNPLVALPFPADEVLAGIELTIISHLHSDHFDRVAQDLLPKTMPILCQPDDEVRIKAKGFQHVTPVVDAINWQSVTITRAGGQHGAGAVLDEMGPVSGFVLQAETEPTLYWTGDTIWCEAVRATLEQVRPAIIVTHSSGATWQGSAPIVMDAAQTVAVCRAAPDSIVVATHLESLDHGQVSRADLRAYAEKQGISAEQLRIPADGDKLNF